VAWFVQSCHEKALNPNAQLTLAEYESLDSSAYKLDVQKIWDEIDHLAVADKDSLLPDNRARRHYFKYRSWGMSGDYKIAIEHGANLVRIGTTIFGEREY